MSKFSLQTFTNFLQTINLEDYRNRFSQIKTVEMDLPRNIQALKTIYEQYWQNIQNLDNPLSFDDYYNLYWNEHKDKILEFWDKTGFETDCDCFKKGLKARIYRTWAALITQIHGGYVAESVFGPDSVKMGTELDHKDIDILITKRDGTEIKIQIKKESRRPEIARMHTARNSDAIVDIYYIVPQDYNSPEYKIGTKKGQPKPWVKDFIKFNPAYGTLDRYENGFIVFTPMAFQEIM